MTAAHKSIAELEAGLGEIRASPAEHGTLAMIVRRPAVDERDVVSEGALDLEEGLVGDSWSARGSSSSVDGGPNPELQLTLMNVRAASLIAGETERVPLAGDQLYVDLDLSVENLPPGSQLSISAAVVEVTAPPHTGCAKFSARFGSDALRFVNSPTGRELRLRGVNAKVVVPGAIQAGDPVRTL